MDQLWAPWRLSYVTTPKEKQAPADDCFICRGVNETNDRANLVVDKTKLSIVILNRFPYNNGHLLVCPKVHKGKLDELSPEELLDLQLELRKMLGILGKRMHPDGFNVGLNLGRA